MARRIYWTFLIASLLAGIALYMNKDGMSANATLWLLTFLSLFMAGSVHGIVAHTLSPQFKGGLILYPLIMGGLFALLIFIFVFAILPQFVPEFLSF